MIVGGNGVNGGTSKVRAYNGGGVNSLNGYGAGGGGATHIARTLPYQLYEFGNPQNASRYVLIVAGGSGGLSDHAPSGGGGGGYTGNTGGNGGGAGGTQTSGAAFGRGEDAEGQSAAGGGGWYGGLGSGGIPRGAGGGSGWCNPILRNAVMRSNEPTPIDKWGGFAQIIISSYD